MSKCFLGKPKRGNMSTIVCEISLVKIIYKLIEAC
jgi:hypothetical protein